MGDYAIQSCDPALIQEDTEQGVLTLRERDRDSVGRLHLPKLGGSDWTELDHFLDEQERVFLEDLRRGREVSCMDVLAIEGPAWTLQSMPQSDLVLNAEICHDDRIGDSADGGQQGESGPLTSPMVAEGHEEVARIRAIHAKRPRKKVKTESGYKGVYFDGSEGQWQAYVRDPRGQLKTTQSKKGDQIYLGIYSDKLHAAYAHDMAALKLGCCNEQEGYSLNFPASSYESNQDFKVHEEMDGRDYMWYLRRHYATAFASGTSSHKGVSKKGSKWEARLSCKTGIGAEKNYYLGLHVHEKAAARFYDLAILYVKGRDAMTNFRPGGYSEQEVARFGDLLEKGEIKKFLDDVALPDS